MKTRITGFLLLGVLSAALLPAQGPPRGGPGGAPPDPATMIQMRVQRLTERLGLSDAQASQATSIFTNAQSAASPLQTNVRDAQQTLQTAVKANDGAGIATAAANIGSLHGQVVAIQSKAEAAFYAILTPDQKTKFDQAGPRGFGGMGGPGMGPGMGPMGGRGGARNRNNQ